jgi:hypothetical protein
MSAMDWLVSKSEVYHRSCSGWTKSVAAGKCEHCATPIPSDTLRIAQGQVDDRESRERSRNVQKSLKSITRRFAEMEARTGAMLQRVSTDADPKKR